MERPFRLMKNFVVARGNTKSQYCLSEFKKIEKELLKTMSQIDIRKHLAYLNEKYGVQMETDDVSDGYHTFGSLYEQRCILFAALVGAYRDRAWKSRFHSDGEPCFGGGWFIVGINTPQGQYTYHYHEDDWYLFDCEEVERAPEWDGHTAENVTRLLSLQTPPIPDVVGFLTLNKYNQPDSIRPTSEE